MFSVDGLRSTGWNLHKGILEPGEALGSMHTSLCILDAEAKALEDELIPEVTELIRSRFWD